MFSYSTFFILLVGLLVGLGRKFLDTGAQPSLNGSSRKLHTSLMWVKAENLRFFHFKNARILPRISQNFNTEDFV